MKMEAENEQQIVSLVGAERQTTTTDKELQEDYKSLKEKFDKKRKATKELAEYDTPKKSSR